MKAKQTLSSKEIAYVYNQLFNTSDSLRDSDAFYQWILDKVELEPGKKLLDVACGFGILVKYAKQRHAHSVGIDLSARAAHHAQKNTQANLIGIANGELLPFPDNSFDFVTNTGSLEHFLDPQRGVEEMRRVLKPGGRAAILLPNSYYLIDIIWHVWRTGYSLSHHQPLERFATFQEWRELLESGGFVVKKAYKYNFCFPKSRNDFQWYKNHPRKILYLMTAPFIPFNLSYHFLYICEKG